MKFYSTLLCCLLFGLTFTQAQNLNDEIIKFTNSYESFNELSNSKLSTSDKFKKMQPFYDQMYDSAVFIINYVQENEVGTPEEEEQVLVAVITILQQVESDWAEIDPFYANRDMQGDKKQLKAISVE